MAQVFAGFVAGYTMALLTTPLAAIAMLRFRASSPLLARILPPAVSVAPLTVLLHGALILFWTALGIVLGLLLLAMRDSGGAAGSLNLAFTLLVFALTLAVLAPFAIILRPVRMFTLVLGVSIVLVFGWLMPYLAEWSKFDSEPAKKRQAPEISWFAQMTGKDTSKASEVNLQASLCYSSLAAGRDRRRSPDAVCNSPGGSQLDRRPSVDV